MFVQVLLLLLFLLNNRADAPILPILFCYETLHVSGIFSAHHQEFSTVHSALVSCMQVFDDRFQAELGRNAVGIISAYGWLFKKKSITMHGNMNVKLLLLLLSLLLLLLLLLSSSLFLLIFSHFSCNCI
jgi:hypothetical protein